MNEKEYKSKLNDLEEEHARKIQFLKRDFALSNQSMQIGDKITNNTPETIIIDKVKYGTRFMGKLPECVYQGYVLTKAGKPRKDKQRAMIFQSEIV